MKVIIAGGRNFKPRDKHVEWLRKIFKEINPTEIVSGGAKGADKFGEFIADKFHIDKNIFKAPWKEIIGKPWYEIKSNQYGDYWVKAGTYRNGQMARYADACILFPGGSGTANMRQQAEDNGLLVYAYEDRVLGKEEMDELTQMIVDENTFMGRYKE